LTAVKPKGEKPSFMKDLKSERVIEGDDLKLSCVMTGKPEPEVKWFKDEEPLKHDRRIRTTCDRGICSMTISDVSMDDTGTYKCHVSNDFGSVSSTAEVNVSRKSIKPEVKDKMKNVETNEEGEARFDIQFSGFPAPDVEWFHGTKKLTDEDKYTMDQTDGQIYSLLVKKVKHEDAGSYKCVASNDAGKASNRAELEVKEKEFAPLFTESIEDQSVKEGQPVNVSVKIKANPKADVSWFKDGERVFDSRNHEITVHGNSHNLYIRKAGPDDAGTYSCEAKNKIGSSSVTFGVQVEGNYLSV